MPDPSLLLLIPAYNEERRIEPVLREYAQFFGRNYPGRFHIIVVLNGCRDNTLGVVQRVAKEFPCIIWLDFPAPIGKGGALIEGLKLAKHGDLIGYVDADGATGPQAFLELTRHIGDADCVIGSRWLPGSVLRQAQPKFRQFISRVFSFHRGTAVLDARQGHAMPLQIDALRCRGKNPLDAVHCRPGVRREPAGVVEARRLQDSSRCRLSGRTRSAPKSPPRCSVPR